MVLPKQMRLKGYRCFDYIYKQGVKFYGPSMVLRVAKGNPKLEKLQARELSPKLIKCAISISNKVSKKAVERNNLRRLFHQHLSLRLSKPNQKFKGTWAFISLKPNCMKEAPSKLLKECDHLLHKAGLIS